MEDAAGPGGLSGAAAAHAADIKRIFGAADRADLVVQKTSRRGRGATVRLTQSIDSVPVYGAGVALALRADGSLLSATGALAERTAGRYPSGATTPTAPARTTAVTKAAELAGVAAEAVRVRAASAAWYDPELSGSGADKAAVAAFRFDIAAGAGGWRVFVAAGSPGVVLDAWQSEENLSRVICDANRQRGEARIEIPCGAEGSYPVVRAEGAPRVARNDDANKVYDWIGDTENFYSHNTDLGSLTDLIGIDAHDGHGKALRATVRVCLDSCPYANAFWSDTEGFVMGTEVLSPDVVAHELTHGVTAKTSNLDYVNESGAINESLSDIFGEFTELSSHTKHAAKDRWKIGNGTRLGVIRDMKSPTKTADPQPDTYQGPGWSPATYSDRNRVPDRGGVHINSGVGNKLAYLITDGDTFNGQTMKGLGLQKAAALYWTVETELYTSADYPALATTLLTACHEAVDDKSAGFADSDCDQVRKAITAVHIPISQDRA
ncbi:bacillolysin [Nocardia sp. GAS34]|uniref:M4 family metallopeptidase n=1 Tax=unclassified Nocardia TaxID=2637762 RepID=UPI003D1FE8A2